MKILLFLFLLLRTLGLVLTFCVLDKKKGWWLDCGIRDSYLFRVKDFGGLQANFDLSFGFGDEKGFPNSISKTNKKGKGHPNYLPPSKGYHAGPPQPHYGYQPQPHHSSAGYNEGPSPGYTYQGYRRTNPQRAQNRRSDFPYQYELPPTKRVLGLSKTRQFVPTKRLYKPKLRPFSRPTYNTIQSIKPPPSPTFPPSLQNGQLYESDRQDRSNIASSNQSPDQLSQRREWIPVSKESRQPWSSSGRGSLSTAEGQNYHHQQQQQQLRRSPQKAQRKGWQDVYPDESARQSSAMRERHPKRSSNFFRRPNQRRRFTTASPSAEFGQRSHQVNGWHSFSSPSSHMLPPPPLPPLPSPLVHSGAEHTRRGGGAFRSSSRFDVFHIPTTTTQPPPTVGPAMSELLKVPAHTSANTDNVPSFAAKRFIVREAPSDFHPPNYGGNTPPKKSLIHVAIPRTKFYCEDQKYLPGIYADSMLGCKMFHLCVPSSLGSTLTSYLCPNGTLFDQSILQCNYWYNVDCESSMKDYDANLALALSYRRINAAHLPLQAATNVNKLSLLSQNMNHLQVSNPKKQVTRRMGRAFEIVPPPGIDPRRESGIIAGIPKSRNTDAVELPDLDSRVKNSQNESANLTVQNNVKKNSGVESSLLTNLIKNIQSEFKVKKTRDHSSSDQRDFHMKGELEKVVPKLDIVEQPTKTGEQLFKAIEQSSKTVDHSSKTVEQHFKNIEQSSSKIEPNQTKTDRSN